MAKIKSSNVDIELQIRAIELLKGSLQLPESITAPIANFNFNLGIESRVDPKNKFIFVVVHVDIKNEDLSCQLGSLSVSCVYEIANFDEVIVTIEEGKFDMPQPMIDMLNGISISTTRGVMYSTFKGTFLHGAVLPIVDPKQFVDNTPKENK